MELLFSLVAVFSLENQSLSIVAQENLTEQLCIEKKDEMEKFRFAHFPFPSYVCIPTKVEPKEEE